MWVQVRVWLYGDTIQLIHLCIPTVPPRWCDPLVLRADCDFTLDHISIRSSEIHEWKCRVASAATGRSFQYTAACRFHGLPAGTTSREARPVSSFKARFHSAWYIKAEAGQVLVLSHGLVSGCGGWFCLALSGFVCVPIIGATQRTWTFFFLSLFGWCIKVSQFCWDYRPFIIIS